MNSENGKMTDFFKNQTIFVTGGGGFLGKLVIEKLLRTCWDVKKIYLLMRPKREKTAEERFDQLWENPCFDLIKNKNLKEKLSFLNGNYDEPLFGLSMENIDILKKETNCVFHLGANVKFNQTFKQASLNIKGTIDILELAKQMQNLKVFLFISTAFSNCIYSYIKEEFYEPPMKAETLFDLVNSIDDNVMQKITPLLLGKWPNTYTYAKSIAEDAIKNAGMNIPVVIIRPAIMTSTINEPIKGWIDNAYGFIGIMMESFLGVLTTMHVIPQNTLNLVPGDYVSNCTLAATIKAGLEKSKTITIYNCVGDTITCEQSNNCMNCFYWEFASVKYMWYKSFKLRESKIWHYANYYFCLLVAHWIDFVLLCCGKRPMATNTYRYISTGSDLVSYFTFYEWKFDEDNVVKLWNEMCEKDKEILKFNLRITNWYDYFRDCAIGIRLYLLKDPLRTIPQGKRRLKMLFIIHHILVIFLYFCWYQVLILLVNCYF